MSEHNESTQPLLNDSGVSKISVQPSEAGHPFLRLNIPDSPRPTRTHNAPSSDIRMASLASPEVIDIEGDDTELVTRKHPEIDDDKDDREVVNKPYPGVDDGFFANGNDKGNNPDLDPDSETIPEDRDPDEIPELFPRFGGDGDSDDKNKKPADGDGGGVDESDGSKRHGTGNTPFNFQPGWGLDYDGDSIPDVNVYQHKKTLAQGMMDLALLSANANQLRYVLESYDRHPYFYPSFVMICLSLILQVAVGVGLIWNANYNVKDDKQICIANKINNFTVIGIFLVTVINVFISAFGVADPVPAAPIVAATTTAGVTPIAPTT